MAFSDYMYLVIFAFLMVICMLVGDYVFNAVMDTTAVQDGLPAATNTSVTTSWENNRDFVNNSFVAIWFILAILSLGLTYFLASNPFVLFGWLFFNFVTLFVYDTLKSFLTVFLASDLNTGTMTVAVAFIENDMAKAVVIMNVLLGCFLFGKRVIAQ